MGVRTDIVVYADSAHLAESAAAAAFDRIAALEQTLSDYRPSSEASLLAQAAGGPPIPISADMASTLAESRRLAEATGGAFDITIGPLVTLWRESRRAGTLPDPAAVAGARALVDFRAVEFDAHAARLARPGMRLDFGGIGKGLAASAALDSLRAHGCARALVALAGDIAVGEPPPGRDGWRITLAGQIAETAGVADPAAPADSAKVAAPADGLVLLLRNAAVSTSGDESQFIEIGGRRYSHIIDPRTGLGGPGGLVVTVVAPRGAWADALATAACVGADLDRLGRFAPRVGIVARGPEGTRVVDPGRVLRLSPRD